MKTILALLPIIISVVSITKGAGIAVFKEQPFHADSSANPIVYKSLIMNEAPFIKLNLGAKQLTIDKNKFVAKIDVPDNIPLNIIKESDLTGLRKCHEDMQSFAKRFTKCAPILKSQIDAVKSHIEKFEGGQVRFSGNWITRANYDNIEKNLLAEEKRLRERDDEMADQKKKKKAEEEAFAANERAEKIKISVDQFPGELSVLGAGVVKPLAAKPGEARDFEIAPGVAMTFCWIPPGGVGAFPQDGSKRRRG